MEKKGGGRGEVRRRGEGESEHTNYKNGFGGQT